MNQDDDQLSFSNLPGVPAKDTAKSRTSTTHTLRPWRFEVVDVDIYALPDRQLADGKVEHSLDNVILAFCGWCGNGTVLLNPQEWFASRRTSLRKPSNRNFVGRSCSYCFATGLLPEKSEYDKIVEEAK
jgi:hypothetical protein